MRSVVTLIIAVSVVAPTAASAVVSCPDRVPLAIVAAGTDAVGCQRTIAKEGQKFVKTKMKALGKCLFKEPVGSCLATGDADQKVRDAALKAAEKIAKACGDDAVQGALTSSYAALTEDGVISSCMLSQHGVTAELLVANATGVSTEDFEALDADANKGRAKCVKELNKSGEKFATSALKNASKCIDSQMKDGVAGDLAPVCVGQYSGGVFVPPTDPKTADKQAKLLAKTEEKIAGACAEASGILESIFACPGATSAGDLQTCILCEGWDGALDLLEQEYAETGTFIPHGAGAFQAAVDGAAEGDKLLIASGDYAEEVVVSTNGLRMVGCGAATDERPRVSPPGGPGSGAVNGIFAANVDGLVFQSLETFDFEENGIFVTGAQGVTFRDVVTDGNINARYGPFPVLSDDVLFELCSTERHDDAAIYVGQSTNIVIRYNRMEGNVAGMEVENCEGAVVHNNYATGNTAGIFVFKDGPPLLQLGSDHQVFNNVMVSNNNPNFAPSGFVQNLPSGTGLLIISVDRTDFHHNVIRNNNSFGIAVLDQQLVASLVGPGTFDPPSPDQKVEDNTVRSNVISGNGADPDVDRTAGVAADLLFGILEDTDHGNCFESNAIVDPVITVPELFITPSDCS
jgi:parallel beta-helix repeat protein